MTLRTGLSFAPSSDEEAMLEILRRFLRQELEPRLKRSGERLLTRAEFSALLKELASFGLVVGPLPEGSGGMGLRWTSYALIFEELAQTSASLAMGVLIQTIIAAFLAARAPEEIVGRYLPAVMRGDLVGAIAISEPDVGSNVAEVKCRARDCGDHYQISGEKTWISNGDYSDFAICVARTGSQADEIALFLVDRTHGYTSRNIAKLGLKATSTAQLFLDAVCVPSSMRLTASGDGLRSVMSVFEIARPLVGMISVGIAQRALDISIAYAQQRRQHGKPIAAHQLVQGMLAEMSTEVDAARLLVHRAFGTIDRGERAEEQSAKAKWYATEMAVGVTSRAIQIHGGNGITAEFPLEELFRNARMMTIPDGTTEIQKLIIGRRLTGVRAF